MNTQSILIVGAGAIGQLYGQALHRAGHLVQMLRSPKAESSDHSSSQTWQFTSLSGVHEQWQSEQITQPDWLLVTTKAYQVLKALEPLQALFSGCKLVLMHNGMGPHEQVQQRWPDLPLLLATTTHGALRESAQHTRHTGTGETWVGALKRSQSSFADAFCELLPADLQAQSCHNILERLWYKLMINCVINPLTARDQVNNGKLCEPQYQSEIRALLEEICRVMLAGGVSISVEQAQQTVLQVAQATAANRSSMLQDVSNQRPTEIEQITGYLVAKAQQAELSLPQNVLLLQQLRNLSQSIPK